MRVRVGEHVVTEGEKKAVMAVLESNQLSPGPRVKEFERLFSYEHGAKYGVLVNSGTDALRIALAALKEVYGWKDGDKVFVPAVTFVATLNIVLQNNLTPVLVDVDPFRYGIDLEKLNRHDDIRFAKCVIPVHLFGLPVRMKEKGWPNPLLEITRPLKIKVLEDSCESMGVADLSGDVACFSTYVCHMISTGVGGIAVTNNNKVHEVMRSLANHGRDPANIPGYKLSKDITKRFRFDRIGYSSRLTEVEAAIGLSQLKSLQDNIWLRRKVCKALLDGLDAFGSELRLPLEYEESSCMMFPLVIQPWSNVSKWKLCKFLEKNGIETREMLPLTNQPCYKDLKIREEDYPVARLINHNGFYIGCHPGMNKADIDHVVDTFKRFFK